MSILAGIRIPAPSQDAQPAADGKPAAAAATAITPATPPAAMELTKAISALSAVRQAFSESKLPPTPPSSFKPWKIERMPDAPHDKDALWPMELYR